MEYYVEYIAKVVCTVEAESKEQAIKEVKNGVYKDKWEESTADYQVYEDY